MTVTADKLQAMQAALQYPANQCYDPVTIEPTGAVTTARIRFMENHLPELMEGGDSLLDVGSNKGFVALRLRDRYKEIEGYEMGRDAFNVAKATASLHGLEHVKFINKPFRWINLGRHSRKYSVVYAGSVHHHFFKDALLHGAPPFLGLKKLAALTEQHLILDGPLTFEGDCSLNTWADRHGWGPDVRALYNLQAHVDALAPQFRLKHGPHDNERKRQAVVFERVEPDIPYVEMSEADVDALKVKGKSIPANRARAKDSVIRVGDVRYKFDKSTRSDGVMMMLNSLPDWFMHTQAVISRDGRRIGDIAEWVEGRPVRTLGELGNHWLKLNNMMSCVGLVEIHLKVLDYVERDGKMIDIDIDMLDAVGNISTAVGYLKKWRVAAARAFGKQTADYLADNLGDEWVFANVLQGKVPG